MAITLDRNKEMFADFQLVYNNLASNLAPGLSKYEISVYLTKALHTFVDTYAPNFEIHEGVRKVLHELVTPESIKPESNVPANITPMSSTSLFFKIPDNCIRIVHEGLSPDSNAPYCVRNSKLKITPVTYDTFDEVYENPYKFTEDRALRLDLTSGNTNTRYVEIVTKNPSYISKYNIRYVRKPKPIILEDLTGTGRTIDNVSTETECELNPFYDKDIIRIAAELAANDYKPIRVK